MGILHANRLRAKILRHGSNVSWNKGIRCPCMSDTGSPDVTCSLCLGTGYYFFGTSYTMKAIIANEDRKYMISRFGLGMPKTVSITIPHKTYDSSGNTVDVIMGEIDKFLLLDDVFLQETDQIFVKGETHGGVSTEMVRHRGIVSVTALLDETREYTEDTDFEIANDSQGRARIINWLPGGNAPTDGERYTIKYTYRPEFLASNQLAKQRTDRGQKMPMLLVAAEKFGYPIGKEEA